jgi:hypothetical protein
MKNRLMSLRDRILLRTRFEHNADGIRKIIFQYFTYFKP